MMSPLFWSYRSDIGGADAPPTVSNGSTKKGGAASASFASSPTENRRSVCWGRY
jgi:hypothetical protein